MHSTIFIDRRGLYKFEITQGTGIWSRANLDISRRLSSIGHLCNQDLLKLLFLI